MRISVVGVILFCLAGCGRVEEREIALPSETIEQPSEPEAVPEEPSIEEVAPEVEPEVAQEPEPEVTEPPLDLATQALNAARRGDFETAVQLGEEARAENPQDAELLAFLARAYSSRGFGLRKTDPGLANESVLKSIRYMREYRAIEGALDPIQQRLFVTSLYNAACEYATGGDPQTALALLGESFDEGYQQVHATRVDDDLANLRGLPEFQTLLTEAHERIMKPLREEARRKLAEYEPFEFSFDLPDTAGEQVTLSDYDGKIVIVDIWGTWCPPCRMEVPHFIDLHQEYRDDGLEIVGLNYERGPEEERGGLIDSFVAEYGVTYRCLIGDDATREMVPNFRGFPTTLLIDRAGVVRAKLVGYRTYEKLDAYLIELLNEGAGV